MAGPIVTPTGTVPDGAPSPPVLLYPSWMDPLYCLRASHMEAVDVASGIGAAKGVVPGDSERWCIGFAALDTFGGIVRIAPSNDPDSYPLVKLSAGQSAWFALSVYGPTVCLPWYIDCAPASTVRVYLVRRF